ARGSPRRARCIAEPARGRTRRERDGAGSCNRKTGGETLVSTATVTSETYTASGVALPGMRQFGMIAGVLGVVLAVAGFFMLGEHGAERFFQAYLIGYTFWMGVVLGCMALLMVQHLSGGVWGIILRRPFEAAVRTL